MPKERRSIQRGRRTIDKFEEQYQALIDSIDEAFCLIQLIFDKEGKPVDYTFLDVNPTLLEYLKVKDVVGKKVTEVFTDREDFWLDKLAQVMNSKEPLRSTQYAEKTGMWFDLYFTKVGNDKDGRIAILFKDVTERKEKNSNIRKSEEKYRIAFDSMDEGFLLGDVIYNKDGDVYDLLIKETNPAYMRMRGLPKQAIIGHTAREIMPSFEKVWLEIMDKALRENQALRVERHAIEADRWFNVFISPIEIVGENNKKIACVFSDTTEQKRIQEELRKSLDSRAEFISVATHELRTPVASLKALAEVSQMTYEKKGDSEAVEIFKDIDEQLDRLTRLINDLHDATKIKEGKLQLHETDFDFDELVREIVKGVRMTSKTHKIVENLNLRGVVCHGDRGRIGQVIINLLTNAIKYSPKKDQVILTSNHDEKNIIFSVQDFGSGIPAKKQKQIFQRFFQADSEDGKHRPGLGLGLYISHEIIERHGGNIWVESDNEKGSTFFFTLPLHKEQVSL